MAKPSSSTSRAKSLSEEAVLRAAQEVIVELGRGELGLNASACPAPDISGCQTVAIPTGVGQTVIGALRNRPNWYALPRKTIDQVARLMVERSWFARPVHEGRVAATMKGFRFADPAAREWADAGTYPFWDCVEDAIREWYVSEGVTIWWRKVADSGKLPVLNVPNNCDVEYDVVAGRKQVSITLRRNSGLKPDQENALGKRLYEAVKLGKKLVITEGDAEFDFAVFKSGKSQAPFQVSPLVGIFDDLDFVEAIRVGDWNGAKARWEIIRQTKKGYSITSGGNAGNVRNHAKKAELTAIVNAMKKIYGKMDLATNFDQEIDYVTFPKEHFHPELLAEVKLRLLHYGGIFALMLLKTDSQITGLYEVMLGALRAEVLGFREKFTPFLNRIFASESFRGGMPSAPDLKVEWGIDHLYSAKGLNELITNRATYALMAPQSLRELVGLDDAEESRLMKLAHEDPKAFTPPFEPRQGIASFFTAPDSAGGNQDQQTMPGEPGRPAES